MTWRDQIKKIGGNKVARAMGVKYPTIHRYIKPGSKIFPREKMNDLCSVMEKFLSGKEYKSFLSSMSEELMGNRLDSTV